MRAFASPQSLLQILGENNCELWVAGVGMTLSSGAVQSWKGTRRGLTLNAATTQRAPLYAADGSYFRGKSVVQFARTNHTGFSPVAVPSLGSASDKGELFLVGRMRSAPTDGDFHSLGFYQCSDTTERYYALIFNASTVGSYSDYGYIGEPYASSNNWHVFPGGHKGFAEPSLINGSCGDPSTEAFVQSADKKTVFGGAFMPQSPGKVTSISIGMDNRIPRGADFSLALAGYNFNPMTAVQRAALVEYLDADLAAKPKPSRVLSGLQIELDPSNALITAGKVESFYGPTVITQATAGSRATYNAADSTFNNRPSATFSGGTFYGLGDLSAWTQGEVFVVLKLDADPAATSGTSGLWNLGTQSATTHYPFTDGVIYDGFGSSNRKTAGDPSASLAAAHIYNVQAGSNNWACGVNGTTLHSSTANTVQFPNATNSAFGRFNTSFVLAGRVAYLALCNQVQSAAQRSWMHHYLSARFGVTVPQNL